MEVESICGDYPSDERGDYVNEHAVVADCVAVRVTAILVIVDDHVGGLREAQRWIQRLPCANGKEEASHQWVAETQGLQDNIGFLEVRALSCQSQVD